eukprot:1815796-Rhodomonas_salina.2
MARKLSGLAGVRWINERPLSHKIDKGLRDFTASSRRTGASSDMSKEEGAVQVNSAICRRAACVAWNSPRACCFQLKKLFVLLVPVAQQHTPTKMAAKDFKELCDKEFAAKKWRAAVTAVNDKKLLIELLEPERAVAGSTSLCSGYAMSGTEIGYYDTRRSSYCKCGRGTVACRTLAGHMGRIPPMVLRVQYWLVLTTALLLLG